MEDKELEILEKLIEKDAKIFDSSLEKVNELAKKYNDDPKKWEFVKCHICDVFYDYVVKYYLIQNLENDVRWYGFKVVYGWLKAIENVDPDCIVKEAIKDYDPTDWLDCSVDEIGDYSMEYFRPLW